jgi:tetratricopeptide (TPR) repeat protein
MKQVLVIALLTLVWLGIATGPAAAMSYPSARFRVEAFARTAVEQAELGDVPGAMETIALAIETAEVIPGGSDWADALGWVAWAQVKIGDTAGAFETAGRVEGSYGADALLRVASALLDTGDLTGARDAAWRAIEHLRSEPSDEEAMFLAGYWILSQAGDVATVREAAMKSTNPNEQSLAWSATALSLAALGDSAGAGKSIALARAAAEKIEGVDDRELRNGVAIWVQAMTGDAAGAVEGARAMVGAKSGNLVWLLVVAAAATVGAPETVPLVLDEMDMIGWLGMDVGAATEHASQELGHEGITGARVKDVAVNGPAEKAGIDKGDFVLGLDGQEVNSPADFARLAAQLPPGARVEVEVWRAGEILRLGLDVKRFSDMADPDFFLVFTSVKMAARASAGDFEGALQSARQIADPTERGFALTALASARVALGDTPGARKAALLAVELARDFPPDHCAKALATMALIETNETTSALRWLGALPEDIDDCGVHSYSVNWGRFLGGDLAGPLLDTFGIDVFGNTGIENAHERAAQVAILRAKLGDAAAALEIAKDITDHYDRDLVLGPLAIAQARIGDPAAARETAKAIGEGKVRGWTLEDIDALERGESDSGAPEAPAKTVAQALTIANPYRRAWWLSELSATLAGRGDMAAAREAAALADEILPDIRDPSLRALAFAMAAKARAAIGAEAAAREATIQARRAAEAEGAPFYRALAFVAAAEALTAAGDLVAARNALRLADEAVQQLPFEKK